MILILTDPQIDIHPISVIQELRRRGAPHTVFNPGWLSTEACLSLEATCTGATAHLHWHNQALDLAQVTAVWYRRPDKPALSPALLPGEASWLQDEWDHAVRGLWAMLNANWVSAPHAIMQASLKLPQLQIARALGFRVPAWLLTNEVARATSFLDAFPGGVVCKALALPFAQAADRSALLYTHLITAADRAHLDAVRHGPTFFQEFVVKACDVRVTVMGQALFATRIMPTTTATQVDFRTVDSFSLPHEPLELPPAVEAACRALVQHLGLQYGAIDLLLTPEGEYVFLEINPNGQWGWIEMITGQPLTSALCDLLMQSPSAA